MAKPNIAMSRTESPATQSFHTVWIVKDYVREHRRRRREMFVPLIHPPGHGQADFGEARAVIGGVARKAHFFVFDLPHSDACYVRAYLVVAAAVLHRAVEVRVEGQPRLLCRAQERRRYRQGPDGIADTQGAAGAVVVVVEALVVLGPLEIGQHVGMGPAGAARRGPGVVVPGVAAGDTCPNRSCAPRCAEAYLRLSSLHALAHAV